MHAISRYCETRPKIIDFILFVGIRDVDHLKERLVEDWTRFDQKIIDESINQWRKRLRACVSADGGHQRFRADNISSTRYMAQSKVLFRANKQNKINNSHNSHRLEFLQIIL